jgi:hypothetical protein
MSATVPTVFSMSSLEGHVAINPFEAGSHASVLGMKSN